MVGEPVEKRGGHFCVAEDSGPFTEGQVCRDDDRGALVELRDQMEEQLPAGLCERQLNEFVEYNKVEPGEMIGNAALPSGARFGFESVDQVDDIEEAATCSVSNEGAGNGNRQMRFARTRPADQDNVALIGDKRATGEVTD